MELKRWLNLILRVVSWKKVNILKESFYLLLAIISQRWIEHSFDYYFQTWIDTKKCSRTCEVLRALKKCQKVSAVLHESPHAYIAHQCSCIDKLFPKYLAFCIHSSENATWSSSSWCAQCFSPQSLICAALYWKLVFMNTSS